MYPFREDLSAPGLWLAVKEYFCRRVTDPRSGNENTEIPIPSALLSACAMFALKYPSLLQFDEQRNGSYLLSVDGTGYFESQSIYCESCREKEKRDGSISYYHWFMPAVVVHPEQKQVLPLGAEPILKFDGASKNARPNEHY